MCGRNRGAVSGRVSECRGQSTLAQTSRNFNGHIGPENRLQSISHFTFVTFFLFSCFEKPEGRDFYPLLDTLLRLENHRTSSPL